MYPLTNESLQLHLEFEEVNDVVFSVIGPRSIHLSGYYLGSGRQFVLNSDSYPSVGFVDLFFYITFSCEVDFFYLETWFCREK